MSYQQAHTDALADVIEAGKAVTFTREIPGTYDDATDTWSAPTTVLIPGYAFAKKSDPIRFATLDLLLNKALTLFFVPTANTLRALTAEFVLPLDVVQWNGVSLAVKDVGPMIALDGSVVSSEIVATT